MNVGGSTSLRMGEAWMEAVVKQARTTRHSWRGIVEWTLFCEARSFSFEAPTWSKP